MEFDKLVRDKIPEKIKINGENPTIRRANRHEFGGYLRKKLLEEVDEFLKSESSEELADILEVIYEYSRFIGTDTKTLEDLRVSKQKIRGGFETRTILIRTD